MYTEFYNLKEKPFSLTPSSRFLYLGEVHKEALALLTYGVVERKGFILLTGEVGTGKTTMIHALLDEIHENTQYVYLSNPLFSRNDFLKYLSFSVFKKKVQFKSKADFLIRFESFLKEQLQHQKNFILIIDEAQKLSFELLEEIRLLSNMETASEKLINIFLVGQPELNETLSLPECRPLLQRISIRYHMKTLDQEGTREYITTRLKMVCRENSEKIIPKNVAHAIYRYSDGYPRMINILADNVLLLGYSRGKRNITPSMVKECYEDLQLDGSFFENRHTIKGTSEIKERNPLQTGFNWKWAVVLILIMFISGIAISMYGKDILGRLGDYLPVNSKIRYNSTNKHTVSIKEIQALTETDSHMNQPKPVDLEKRQKSKENIIDRKETDVDKDALIEVQEPSLSEDAGKGTGAPEIISATRPAEQNISVVENITEEWKAIVVVKKNETLTELTTAVYGYADKNILELIQKYNPEIEDINLIEVGQKISFPQLSVAEHGQSFTVHISSFKPFDSARDLFEKLIREGYEVYIIPVYNARKGKLFRVTLGNFESQQKAREYASWILENDISDYANTIRLEMQ